MQALIRLKCSEEQKKEFAELGANSDYLIFTRETADEKANLEENGLGKCRFLFRW